MVGKTSDGRILEFKLGDIITTENGEYYILIGSTGSSYGFIRISNNETPDSSYRFKINDLPTTMKAVISFDKIGKEDKQNLETVLKQLEIPSIDHIFPKEERVNLNDENIIFDPEIIVNKYTQAVLLLEYMEKLVDHFFEKTEEKTRTVENLNNVFNNYFVKYAEDFTSNFITSDGFVDGIRTPRSKKVANKVRPTKFEEAIDSPTERPSIQVSDNSNWTS